MSGLTKPKISIDRKKHSKLIIVTFLYFLKYGCKGQGLELYYTKNLKSLRLILLRVSVSNFLCQVEIMSFDLYILYSEPLLFLSELINCFTFKESV